MLELGGDHVFRLKYMKYIVVLLEYLTKVIYEFFFLIQSVKHAHYFYSNVCSCHFGTAKYKFDTNYGKPKTY